MSDYNEVCELYVENVESEISNFMTFAEETMRGKNNKEINAAITKKHKVHQTNTENEKTNCLHKIYKIYNAIVEPFSDTASVEIKIAKEEYNSTVKLATMKRDADINKIEARLKKEKQPCDYDRDVFIKTTNYNAFVATNALKDIYRRMRNVAHGHHIQVTNEIIKKTCVLKEYSFKS